MGRWIDPSELEGDELTNWYRRSPADVEAEREAARQDRYDAFVSGIRPPTEPQDSLEGEPRVIRARFPLPTTAPVMSPPSGPMVGPTLDARGVPPTGASRSGFFDTHNFSPVLGGYQTDLPNPLNYVEGTPGGRWVLGDNSRVPADEVERIYAEQQRRLRGREEVEPAAHVHVVDRLQDGHIPQADQIAKDDRELDATCHPQGGWERDPGFAKYSQRTRDYEPQITHAPGLDYVVRIPGKRPVKFDGCAVWDQRHPLLEAKGPGYASLLPKAVEWGFFGNMWRDAVDQADRQASAAPRQRIEWHIAEPAALKFFDGATWPERPPIVLEQTPAR